MNLIQKAFLASFVTCYVTAQIVNTNYIDQKCAENPNYLTHSPTNCSQYLVCNPYGSGVIVYTCPPGTYFDHDLKLCNYINQVTRCSGACRSNPCGAGVCRPNPDNTFTCLCDETGFTGPRCSQVQTFGLGCNNNPCLNGGVCTNVGTNGFSCRCTSGYTGTQCQTPVGACVAQLPPVPSPGCNTAMISCSDEHLTKGKCRSTWNGLQLDFIKNDRDMNCAANNIDFTRDNLYYDLDNNGQITLSEWTIHRAVYNGFTPEFNVGYFRAKNFTSPFDVLDTTNVYLPLKSAFEPGAVQALATFCSLKDNQKLNRDCWNLAVICKEKRPNFPACTSFNPYYLTLKEKLDINQRLNDPNRDGIVEYDERRDDLNDNYDVNKDGCTTQDEWVNRWVNFYGFSTQYSKAVYVGINKKIPNCVKPTDFNHFKTKPFRSAFALPTDLLKGIIGMCQKQPKLYETNVDCALLADTCITYYASLKECQPFVKDCGMQQYSDCVGDLTLPGKACSDRNDKQVVDVEERGTRVQIYNTCKAAAPKVKCGSEPVVIGK